MWTGGADKLCLYMSNKHTVSDLNQMLSSHNIIFTNAQGLGKAQQLAVTLTNAICNTTRLFSVVQHWKRREGELSRDTGRHQSAFALICGKDLKRASAASLPLDARQHLHSFETCNILTNSGVLHFMWL